MDEPMTSGDGESGDAAAPDRVGDALRSAVERTLAATAGSASGTRQRARDLLDEVARRGDAAREEIGRRGDAARQEVSRRGEAAREEVARRGEAARGEVAKAQETASNRLADRIGVLERRLAELEQALRSDSGEVSPEANKPLEHGAQPVKPQAQVEPENPPVEPESGG